MPSLKDKIEAEEEARLKALKEAEKLAKKTKRKKKDE